MKLCCLFGVALLCAACGRSQADTYDPDAKVLEVRFKGENESDLIRMSDIFVSVAYIHLDDADGDALIGEIGSIRVTEAGIFVSDRLTHTICLFDAEGGFIRSYCHRGRGHGEYVMLTGFDVCKGSGNISVYDGASRRMCVYSADDRFLYDFRIDDIPRDFAVADNGDYLFFTPDYMRGVRRGIWQTDSSGVFKRQLVAIGDEFKFNSGIHEQYFQHFGNRIIVSGSEQTGELYHIAGDTIGAAYRLATDVVIPKRLRNNPIADLERHKGRVYTIYNYFETDDWMSVTLSDMLKIVMVFYDKSEDKPYFISSDEDIVEDMPHIGVMRASTEDALIGELSVGHILSYESLREQFPNVNEDSNPVISICRTK